MLRRHRTRDTAVPRLAPPLRAYRHRAACVVQGERVWVGDLLADRAVRGRGASRRYEFEPDTKSEILEDL